VRRIQPDLGEHPARGSKGFDTSRSRGQGTAARPAAVGTAGPMKVGGA